MKTALKIVLIFLVTIILALALAPVGGALHNSFWEYGGCEWGLPCNEGSQVEGFVYFYVLLLSLLSFLLLKNKTAWLTFGIGSLLFWVYFIHARITEGLKSEQAEDTGVVIIMFISFVIGCGLAFGIKKFKKTKTNT